MSLDVRESRRHRVEQYLSIDRLVQECNRTSGQSLRASLFTLVRGEEDDRNAPSICTEISLQLQAVHPGHPPVENQAADRRKILAMQKLFGGREDKHGESDGAQKTRKRNANRFIVINYCNDRLTTHDASKVTHARIRSQYTYVLRVFFHDAELDRILHQLGD
jgi:hypothetical protein